MTGPPEPPDAGSPLRGLLTPRLRRVDLAVAALLAVLGFAAVVQVRSTQSEGPLATARQEDLVQILDELGNRNDRLRAEVSELDQTREELSSGTGAREAALADTRRRAQQLGVLAGTVPARGPGLRFTILDPAGAVDAAVLLGALQELRAAGAEAVQLEGPVDAADPEAGTKVRVVASTALVDGQDGGVLVDGELLRPPYRFTAVGEPVTLERALGIAGGAVDTVESGEGGRAILARDDDLLVGALRVPQPPRYARPAS